MEGFLLLAVFGYFAYRNGNMAKLKGRNAIGWGMLTIAAVFVGYMISTLFVVLVFVSKKMDLSLLTNPENTAAKQQFIEKMSELVAANPAHLVVIMLGCFGGYLLIRYIIERLPYKN